MAIDAFNFSRELVDKDGLATVWFRGWLRAVTAYLNQTAATAGAATPQTTQVVAVGGLQGGGTLSANAPVALYVAVTSATLLPVSGAQGDWAFALDGRKPGEGAGVGTGVPCFYSAGNWVSACSGAAVTV